VHFEIPLIVAMGETNNLSQCHWCRTRQLWQTNSAKQTYIVYAPFPWSSKSSLGLIN